MRWLTGFLLVILCWQGSILQAANRIGVVDLDKVFREFYKSRIAEDAIRRQGELFRNYLLKLNDEYRKLQQEGMVALNNAQNLALSGEERDKATRLSEQKKREITEKKAEIELYASERAKDMRRIEESKRAEIMAEIRAELKRRAAAEGIDFIFDSSGKTLNNQPALLCFPASADLTARVILELNRSATVPAEKKSSKK